MLILVAPPRPRSPIGNGLYFVTRISESLQSPKAFPSWKVSPSGREILLGLPRQTAGAGGAREVCNSHHLPPPHFYHHPQSLCSCKRPRPLPARQRYRRHHHNRGRNFAQRFRPPPSMILIKPTQPWSRTAKARG